MLLPFSDLPPVDCGIYVLAVMLSIPTRTISENIDKITFLEQEPVFGHIWFSNTVYQHQATEATFKEKW